jgi:hypothetical protein
MHILYIDDSGSASNPNEAYFVLGGVSVFERGIYHLIKAADDCVKGFGLDAPDDVELHATDIYGGRGQPWRTFRERSERERFLRCVGSVLIANNRAVTLFAVAVNKAAVSPEDCVELAFEEISNRFNLFLQRNNNRNGEQQRGLIVMDESRHKEPLQSLARTFRVSGSRWGKFRNLAEVPLFVDSKSTRIVQLADYVAWATFRRYQFEDGRFFDPILPRFDNDGGVIHGLYHARGSRTERCYCPACMSRDGRNR